jgi:hypothetical protein
MGEKLGLSNCENTGIGCSMTDEKRYFSITGRNYQKTGANCMMGSFMICISYQ